MEGSESRESDREARTWAMVAHAGGPVGLLLSAGLLGFVVPLVVWLVKREESAFIDDQAKEALNFQITLFLLHALVWCFVLFTLGIGLLLAWPIFVVLWLLELVLGGVAALRAYEGQRYRYPIALRLIR